MTFVSSYKSCQATFLIGKLSASIVLWLSHAECTVASLPLAYRQGPPSCL